MPNFLSPLEASRRDRETTAMNDRLRATQSCDCLVPDPTQVSSSEWNDAMEKARFVLDQILLYT